MILLKKRPHLLLEIPLAVMRLLLLDVLQQRPHVRRTHGKRPIPALPPKRLNAFNFHPLRRRDLDLFNELRNTLLRMHPHRQMHMIGHPTHPQTLALFVANDGREVRMQSIPHIIPQIRTTILGTEDNMDQQKAQRLGHDEDYRSLYTLAALSLTMLTLCTIGCTSTPKPTPSQPRTATTTTYPPRPTTPPPPFRLFHQTDNSLTLVTSPTASDQQIAAILYQLRDAAQSHTFDALHLPQKLIDARTPYIWFHLYRGPKCASEKYAAGQPPCGPSYHAAGDFTLGSFKNPNHTDAALFHDETHQTNLFNSDNP
jgi:hypothetical protein